MLQDCRTRSLNFNPWLTFKPKYRSELGVGLGHKYVAHIMLKWSCLSPKARIRPQGLSKEKITLIYVSKLCGYAATGKT